MNKNKEKYSPREKEISHELQNALSTKMIADKFGISENTVRTEKKNLYYKARVHSVTQLLKEMREHPEDF